jgi:predicted nuclease with TOPRIM domain
MKTHEEMFHYINRLSMHGEHWDEYDTKREIKDFKDWTNQLATDGREELEKECEIKINATIQATKDYLKSRELELEELKAENKTLQDAFDNNLKEIMLLGTHAKDLEAEIERLSGLLVSLSNGEAMNVVRESEGVYSVIFKTPKKNP